MKVNFKVKMKVTIEFLVEIYFRNDLHFFEKYFTWGNIQPPRDFLDTLYICNNGWTNAKPVPLAALHPLATTNACSTVLLN